MDGCTHGGVLGSVRETGAGTGSWAACGAASCWGARSLQCVQRVPAVGVQSFHQCSAVRCSQSGVHDDTSLTGATWTETRRHVHVRARSREQADWMVGRCRGAVKRGCVKAGIRVCVCVCV